MKPVEKLCLACGLCCDGTLFEHVRLGAADDAKYLRDHGLPVLGARTRPRLAHTRQPCAALCANGTCAVYERRPAQCRAFECGVFADLAAKRITLTAARRLTQQAKRRADRVLCLLRQLGDHEEQLPLAERFRRTLERMESEGGDEAAGAKFAELGLAVHRLNLLAHDKFYTRADTPKKCSE